MFTGTSTVATVSEPPLTGVPPLLLVLDELAWQASRNAANEPVAASPVTAVAPLRKARRFKFPRLITRLPLVRRLAARVTAAHRVETAVDPGAAQRPRLLRELSHRWRKSARWYTHMPISAVDRRFAMDVIGSSPDPGGGPPAPGMRRRRPPPQATGRRSWR